MCLLIAVCISPPPTGGANSSNNNKRNAKNKPRGVRKDVHAVNGGDADSAPAEGAALPGANPSPVTTTEDEQLLQQHATPRARNQQENAADQPTHPQGPGQWPKHQ